MANRLLVKLLPSVSLAAADSRGNLRPLYDSAPQTAAFGMGAAPAWFLADLPDEAATPWDLAHGQVAGQLGIDESAVLFAEPDLAQSFPDTNEKNPGGSPFALDQNCGDIPQQDGGGKIKGPDKFAWHLDDAFTQLRSARDEVKFTDPRTRIAHIDTGYDRAHGHNHRTCSRTSSEVLSMATVIRTAPTIRTAAMHFLTTQDTAPERSASSQAANSASSTNDWEAHPTRTSCRCVSRTP
ncbi:MAG TPA: hypothetical protein VKA97_02755 [Pyrinomonadaceae bacterium]|nr:hypothetical protein [Pyrinomonadaceae bacterium]